MLGFILSAVWWLLVIGAAFQSGRAWGLATGLGALVLLVVVGHLGLLGVALSTIGALVTGYRAETVLERPLLRTDS